MSYDLPFNRKLELIVTSLLEVKIGLSIFLIWLDLEDRLDNFEFFIDENKLNQAEIFGITLDKGLAFENEIRLIAGRVNIFKKKRSDLAGLQMDFYIISY